MNASITTLNPRGAFTKKLSVNPINLSLEAIPDPFSQLIASSSESEQGCSVGCCEGKTSLVKVFELPSPVIS